MRINPIYQPHQNHTFFPISSPPQSPINYPNQSFSQPSYLPAHHHSLSPRPNFEPAYIPYNSPPPILYKSSNTIAPHLNSHAPIPQKSRINNTAQTVFTNEKWQHINQVIPKVGDMGGLYIGDTIATKMMDIFSMHGIGGVLCCNREASSQISEASLQVYYKYLDISDNHEYPIKKHFKSAYEFIDSIRIHGANILVQCHAGISRSATIVCAYLMKKNNWRLHQALSYLKQKRSRINPNASFMRQLKEYQQQLFAQQVPKNSIQSSTIKKQAYELQQNQYKREKSLRELETSSPIRYIQDQRLKDQKRESSEDYYKKQQSYLEYKQKLNNYQYDYQTPKKISHKDIEQKVNIDERRAISNISDTTIRKLPFYPGDIYNSFYINQALSPASNSRQHTRIHFNSAIQPSQYKRSYR